MLTAAGTPLSAQIVTDGAEVQAAPKTGAAPRFRLGFGDTRLLYAFQPARGPGATPRFALVGPTGEPGKLDGWVSAPHLLAGDTGLVTHGVVRADRDTVLRAGPDPRYRPVGNAEHWFLAAIYAERNGHLLVGPLQATGDASATPQLGGWLARDAVLPWDGGLGARFATETRNRRDLARIRGEGGATLYAEPASDAALAPGANRFPVITRPEADGPPLQVALPGASVGTVSERDATGRVQLRLERLSSKAQVVGAQRLFRRVVDRARGEPRSLATAVEAATGSATVSLAAHCVATWGLPLDSPTLDLPAEALTTACLRDPGGCGTALAALKRSADALDSVLEETTVQLRGDEVVPVREHSWSKGPRPHPYWWRGGDGRELAWVPVEFFP
jgi:hypothetical protein